MRRTSLSVALFVCVAVVAPAVAFAQEPEPIATDRPDFTESPLVVPLKAVQVETGVQWTRDAVGDFSAKSFSAPNALVRLSLGSRVEFRVGMEGLVRENGGTHGSWATSASDADVGAKVQFSHQDGAGLDTALIAFVSLPIGGRISSGDADPAVKFAWGRSLGETSVTGNFGVASLTNVLDQRDRLLEASLSLGRGLWGDWSGFLEGVVSDLDDGTTAAWTANTGLTWLLSPDHQLDVYLGRGLNDSAPDWAVGAGFSVRFRR